MTSKTEIYGHFGQQRCKYCVSIMNDYEFSLIWIILTISSIHPNITKRYLVGTRLRYNIDVLSVHISSATRYLYDWHLSITPNVGNIADVGTALVITGDVVGSTRSDVNFGIV